MTIGAETVPDALAGVRGADAAGGGRVRDRAVPAAGVRHRGGGSGGDDGGVRGRRHGDRAALAAGTRGALFVAIVKRACADRGVGVGIN